MFSTPTLPQMSGTSQVPKDVLLIGANRMQEISRSAQKSCMEPQPPWSGIDIRGLISKIMHDFSVEIWIFYLILSKIKICFILDPKPSAPIPWSVSLRVDFLADLDISIPSKDIFWNLTHTTHKVVGFHTRFFSAHLDISCNS